MKELIEITGFDKTSIYVLATLSVTAVLLLLAVYVI